MNTNLNRVSKFYIFGSQFLYANSLNLDESSLLNSRESNLEILAESLTSGTSLADFDSWPESEISATERAEFESDVLASGGILLDSDSFQNRISNGGFSSSFAQNLKPGKKSKDKTDKKKKTPKASDSTKGKSSNNSTACPFPGPGLKEDYEPKQCPTNAPSSCINGNKPYNSLKEAWEACGTVEGCGNILEWTDKKFYLRRRCDPTCDPRLDGKKCGKGYEYCETCIFPPNNVTSDTEARDCEDGDKKKCINNNKPYETIKDAWIACGKVECCGIIN